MCDETRHLSAAIFYINSGKFIYDNNFLNFLKYYLSNCSILVSFRLEESYNQLHKYSIPAYKIHDYILENKDNTYYQIFEIWISSELEIEEYLCENHVKID